MNSKIFPSIFFKVSFLCCISIAISGCTKLVHIEPPTSSITTTEVFADSADASAAILGIYTNLNTTSDVTFTNGCLSIYTGSSADELVDFTSSANIYQGQIFANAILAENTAVQSYFWQPGYTTIYQTNACIEGIQSSQGINTQTKNQLIGEAKFIRALVDFYLVNLFGDIPLITTSNYKTNALATRTAQSQVYQAIIDDLTSAQALLPTDYSISGGQRIRANKWAATGLLARAYLFTKDYSDAASTATSIINNTNLFSLEPNLNDVFSTISNEAILQWNLNTSIYPFNSTAEGYRLLPNPGNAPYYYLNSILLNAFEPGDQRKVAWLDSTTYLGTTYYIPYKYKNGSLQASANASPTEYYTVLRLAEQYLIRAEARAQLGDSTGAIADLNAIRIRAGLPAYNGATDLASLLSAILHERQIELFAEWGHRWLDLKRMGKVDSVMSVVTPLKNVGTTWNSFQQLYPIPETELNLDPNLRQNPGY